MHLTNYAINKNKKEFELKSDISDVGSGMKRSFQWFESWFNKNGFNYSILREEISSIVNKAILSVSPLLTHT